MRLVALEMNSFFLCLTYTVEMTYCLSAVAILVIIIFTQSLTLKLSLLLSLRCRMAVNRDGAA